MSRVKVSTYRSSSSKTENPNTTLLEAARFTEESV